MICARAPRLKASNLMMFRLIFEKLGIANSSVCPKHPAKRARAAW